MTRFAFTAMPAGSGVGARAGFRSEGGGAAAAVSGVIRGAREASDEQSLRAALRSEGFIALEIRPLKVMDAFRASFSSTDTKLRKADAAWFFQMLARLLKHAVPVESALNTMDELAPTPRAKDACVKVREALRGGVALADAVERIPGLATRQHVALLRSAQSSGKLDHAAILVDRSIASTQKLRRTIASGLIYPGLLLCTSIAVVWFLATFVIPTFAETLDELGGKLPWQTAVTLWAARILVWAFPIAVVGGVILWRVRGGVLPPGARRAIAEYSLRAPVVGPLLWNAQGAMVCDTLATMIEGGADVLSGLGQAEEVASSPVVARRVGEARRKVREGIDLGRAFRECQVLPREAQAVVQIGMRSGDLTGALGQAAAVCTEHQERVTQRLLSLLEPLVIVVMAGAVGWVVYSLVVGMLAMNQASSTL